MVEIDYITTAKSRGITYSDLIHNVYYVLMIMRDDAL